MSRQRLINRLGLIADCVLFLSGLVLLVDLAPRDLMPRTRRQKVALEKLRQNHNLLLSLPPKTNVLLENQTTKLVSDPTSAQILIDLIHKRSPLAHTVPWDRVVGMGFSAVSIPVAQLKLDAFHPLYITALPPKGSTTMELFPVGQLEDVDRWLSAWHQSSLTFTAAIFLTCGFLLQLVVRLFGSDGHGDLTSRCS
jgi:hypothetical protein